jgi:hypothetical protein
MVVYFTEEISSEIRERISFIAKSRAALDAFFLHKEYGNDLKVLYISIVCVHPRFADFFKERKPKFISEDKEYIEKGIKVLREGKSLSYDLRLDYNQYLSAINPELLLSQNVLSSLEVVNTIKKIKDFNLVSFRNDLEKFFKLNGWLS